MYRPLSLGAFLSHSLRLLALVRCLQILVFLLAANSLAAQNPRLLPPPSDFRFTLEPASTSVARTLPPNASCAGEAALMLPCRAFTFTLKNTSSHLVRISEVQCQERQIKVERMDPNSSSSWWPVSSAGSHCNGQTPMKWSNTRLRPGEHLSYTTRLIGPLRGIDEYLSMSGTYQLRAEWALMGCTDSAEDGDCLTPLQAYNHGPYVPDVDMQEPVSVQSNVVNLQIDPLPDLGPLRFALQVSAPPPTVQIDQKTAKTPPNPDPHCPDGARSTECIVFHYTVRNLGPRAVRDSTFSCSGGSITPEYRIGEGAWQPLPQRAWSCTANIYFSRTILPGGSLEGTFQLRYLTPGWTVTPLRPAGTYSFRFTFWPQSCIASPDGSFCLTIPKLQPQAVSPEVVVTTTAALGEPDKDPF